MTLTTHIFIPVKLPKTSFSIAGAVNVTSGVWELNTDLLIEPRASKPTYEIAVVINKDTRSATASVILETVEGIPPEVKIV